MVLLVLMCILVLNKKNDTLTKISIYIPGVEGFNNIFIDKNE